MKRPRLFAEIPAGLASVSLVLQGGRHCKPPVSRMGNKHGYALPILDAMGLRPGLGAESYLWTEADPDVRALLCAYTQPELLRAVAEVLRGWVDEEPRALWTRLRDERRARKAAILEAEALAGWLFVAGGSMMGLGSGAFGGNLEGWENGEHGNGTSKRPLLARLPDAALRLATGPGWPPVAVTATAPSAEEVAGWLAFQTHTLKTGGFAAEHVGSPGSRRPADLPVGRVGELASLPWPPTLVTAQAPSAERVAGWVAYQAWDMRGSYRGPGHGGSQADVPASLPSLAGKAGRLAEVSTLTTAPTPGTDLEGCVIYMDPPYVGTTGYGADLPRAEVVRLATEYADAGALVVVSEAVAIPELTALGWDAIDIAGERRGQKRTFSKEQGEWITMSRPPVNRPRIQVGLFG